MPVSYLGQARPGHLTCPLLTHPRDKKIIFE